MLLTPSNPIGQLSVTSCIKRRFVPSSKQLRTQLGAFWKRSAVPAWFWWPAQIDYFVIVLWFLCFYNGWVGYGVKPCLFFASFHFLVHNNIQNNKTQQTQRTQAFRDTYRWTGFSHLYHKVPERVHDVDRQGVRVHCTVLQRGTIQSVRLWLLNPNNNINLAWNFFIFLRKPIWPHVTFFNCVNSVTLYRHEELVCMLFTLSGVHTYNLKSVQGCFVYLKDPH